MSSLASDTLGPSSAIALLTGSRRTSNNTDGLAAWLITRFNSVLAQTSPSTHSLKLASDLSTLPLPWGAVEDSLIAQAVPLGRSEKYSDPAVRAWSKTIMAAPAMVILTPQYNWSFPGPLKNLLDHLYNEWAGKPVVLVTFGGHGGSKAAQALEIVLEGGLHMDLMGKVAITLPSALIRTEERVGSEGEEDAFLREYKGAVDEAFGKLLEAIKAKELQL